MSLPHCQWQRLPSHSKQEYKASQIPVGDWPPFGYKLSSGFLILLNTVRSQLSLFYYLYPVLCWTNYFQRKKISILIYHSVILDVKLLWNSIYRLAQMLQRKSCCFFHYETGVMPVWTWHTGTAKCSYTGCDRRIIWSYDIDLMQSMFYSVGVLSTYIVSTGNLKKFKKIKKICNLSMTRKELVPYKIGKKTQIVV